MKDYCGFIEVYSGKHSGSHYTRVLSICYLEKQLECTMSKYNIHTVAIFKIKLK